LIGERTIQLPGCGLLRREIGPDCLRNSDRVARRDAGIHIWQAAVDFEDENQRGKSNGKQGQAAPAHSCQQANHGAAADGKCPDASDAAPGTYA